MCEAVASLLRHIFSHHIRNELLGADKILLVIIAPILIGFRPPIFFKIKSALNRYLYLFLIDFRVIFTVFSYFMARPEVALLIDATILTLPVLPAVVELGLARGKRGLKRGIQSPLSILHQ